MVQNIRRIWRRAFSLFAILVPSLVIIPTVNAAAAHSARRPGHVFIIVLENESFNAA
jgi:hypothetical protein